MATTPEAGRGAASPGFFGIGVENLKTGANLGTLWRSAHAMGAAFIFTVGRRYRHQASDTSTARRSVPLYEYATLDELRANLPHGAKLVGVEYPHDRAVPLGRYCHPRNCVYLLGSEDSGMSKAAAAACHDVVFIPTTFCLNVAAAGSVVLWDRLTKKGRGG